jgi:adenylate cyclase
VRERADQPSNRSRLVSAGAISALVFAGVLALRSEGLLVGLELFAYDRMLGLAVSGPDPNTPVVIVEVTERDIGEQKSWPISDRALAEAIIAILDDGARAVGFDIVRDLPVNPGHELLERVLRTEKRTFAANKFGDPSSWGIRSPPALEGSGRVGFADVLHDDDEAVRRALLIQNEADGAIHDAFPLMLAESALKGEGIFLTGDPVEPTWMRFGTTTVPPLVSRGGYPKKSSGGYQILVDFASGKGGFPSYRIGEVLDGEIPPETFREKIVLIGYNARSVPDDFSVPLGGRIRGVELLAHVTDQLVRHARGISAPIVRTSNAVEIGCMLIAAILGCTIACAMRGSALRGVSGLLITMLAAAIAIAIAAALAFRLGTWFPVMGIELSWLASAGFVTAWLSSRERDERGELMGLFERHVSPSVADEIWRRRAEILRDGRLEPLELPVTVVFVDMKDYSAQAEKMRPEELLVWGNHFLERMGREVEGCGGVVEDYFGDGFKANFGVPIPRSSQSETAEDARQAVESALAIASALDEINHDYQARGLPYCEARVGIHSDTAVAGSIGTPGHLKYSVVGDVTVTAQRLESTMEVDHDYDRMRCRIIVSKPTQELLGDHFVTEPVGPVTLKGKQEAIPAYRVLGKREPV